MFYRITIILILAFLSFELKAQGHLKLDNDTVDFGVIQEGDTIKYDFYFTNIGPGDLVIKQAWPSCGCTIPSYTKEIIKTNERGKIHIEFHSKGFGGEEVLKEIIIINSGKEQYAYFKAKIIPNDPNTPRIKRHK